MVELAISSQVCLYIILHPPLNHLPDLQCMNQVSQLLQANNYYGSQEDTFQATKELTLVDIPAASARFSP